MRYVSTITVRKFSKNKAKEASVLIKFILVHFLPKNHESVIKAMAHDSSDKGNQADRLISSIILDFINRPSGETDCIYEANVK